MALAPGRLAQLLASCEGSSHRIVLRAENQIAILERENDQLRKTLNNQAHRINYLELRLEALGERALT
jgi:predicted RNase H-like nuclease (RuvC/YqgF family)